MHPFLLKKNCTEAFEIPLILIIRSSLVNIQLPVQFRSVNITPLIKKGDKTVLSNYFPASLTLIPCKIMDSIIRAKVEECMYENNLIAKEQHGFIRNKSCTTNLLGILTSFH